MPITSIQRDFSQSPNIVRITTTDSLVSIVTTGYWTTQKPYVHALQHGNFVWVSGDLVAINYEEGDGFFTFNSETQAFSPEDFGQSTHAIAIAGTTANLTATYDNGASGVGATLTNTGTLAAFETDDISPTVSQRILVKNQSSSFQNGIYVVTVVGSASVPWILTRASDFDSSENITAGDIVIVALGTTLAQSSWMQENVVNDVGVDPISFVAFSLTFPIPVTQGGTHLTSTSLGGMLYGTDTDQYAILDGNTSTDKLFLSQTGNGLISAAPAWTSLSGGDVLGFTTGSVIFAGASGSLSQDNARLFYNHATFRLGVGTAAPAATLGVVGNVDDFQVVASDNETNSTTKNFRLGVRHYTNSEEPLVGLYAYSGINFSNVEIGGGTGFGNTATQVDIFAAANNTTVSGTNITKYTISGQEQVTGYLRLTPQTASTALYLNATKDITGVALTNGQLLIGSTGANPAAGNITMTGGTVTNGAGTIALAVTGSGLTWNDVTGTSASMAINNGYIANNAGVVTLTLPVTAAIGSVIHVRGLGAGGWLIAQNASQSIHSTGGTTTVGVGGSLASTNRYNSVNLTCVVANNEWDANAIDGALTIV